MYTSNNTPRKIQLVQSRGFTLIELLVVIAIIGLLASVVTASLNSARAKGKDARRIADMHEIQQALELYNNDNGQYPLSVQPSRSQCAVSGSYPADQVIPGLVPQYLPTFPSDPDMNASANTCCYIYGSNGTDYKFLDFNCPTMNYNSAKSLIDPARDGGSDRCLVDGTTISAWAIFTSGGCSW